MEIRIQYLVMYKDEENNTIYLYLPTETEAIRENKKAKEKGYKPKLYRQIIKIGEWSFALKKIS